MARSIIFASFLLPVLLLLLCCFPMPLGADFVPVSISQQVSVSGSAQACDSQCQTYILPVLYPGQSDYGQSFSNTQKNPPEPLSISGGVTDTLGTGGLLRTASASADASQSVISAANSFKVNLEADDALSSNTTLVTGGASADSQYALTFKLTSPYLVQLTGLITDGTEQGVGRLFGDFDGEVHLTELYLTGPVTLFDQILSCAIYSPCGQQIDAAVVLGPGVYTLDALAGLTADEMYTLDSTSNINLSLTADFTAVPEPERISYAAGVLMAAGICFARKRLSSC